jgi:multiple sugar transport system permease protein
MISRRGSRGIAYHLLALAVAALFVLPFAGVLAWSLRQPGLPPPRGIEWVPSPIAWENYRRIFELVPLLRYTLNSLLVVGLAVPLTLVTASWAGLGMALLHGRLRRRLLVLAVLLRLVPVTALWLTRFVLFARLGLLDTVWALIAPALMGSSPFFVLLYYWTFRRVPAAVFESARLDGAGPLRLWARIAWPLARPTTVTVAVLTFVLYWRDFITPLLYLRSERLYTLSVGLRQLQQLRLTDLPLLLAGAVVMTAPIVLLFLLAQRHFWPEDRVGGR